MLNHNHPNSENRVLYFDLLNIAACLAVIFLHHNGIVHSFQNNSIWAQALIVEVWAYWAVPVFLMLSGATLMTYRKRCTTGVFLRRRFERTVIPFLFWSSVCLALNWMMDPLSFQGITLSQMIGDVLNHKYASVYWFFPTIFAVYLFMPVLSHLADEKYHRTLWYFVGVHFVCYSVIPPMAKLLGLGWNSTIGMPVSGSLLLVVLGYLLANTEFQPGQRRAIYIAGIASGLFRYAAVYLLCVRDGTKNDLFFHASYFPGVLLGAAVFVLFKYARWNISGREQKAIRYLSGCSLGIYLIHKLVMSVEQRLLTYSTSSLVWRIFAPFLTYVVALSLISVMKKIPYLRKIVP